MSNTSRKKYLLQSWQIHLRTCILCLRRKTCCYLPLGWVHTNANTHGSSVTKQTNRPRCVSASVCGQADPPSASCHRRDVYPICHDNLSSNRLRRRVPHCSYGYPHTHTPGGKITDTHCLVCNEGPLPHLAGRYLVIKFVTNSCLCFKGKKL